MLRRPCASQRVSPSKAKSTKRSRTVVEAGLGGADWARRAEGDLSSI